MNLIISRFFVIHYVKILWKNFVMDESFIFIIIAVVRTTYRPINQLTKHLCLFFQVNSVWNVNVSCMCVRCRWMNWMNKNCICSFDDDGKMYGKFNLFLSVGFYGSKLLSWTRTISQRSRVLFYWKKLLLFYRSFLFVGMKNSTKKNPNVAVMKNECQDFIFNRRSLVFLFLIEKRMFEEKLPETLTKQKNGSNFFPEKFPHKKT